MHLLEVDSIYRQIHSHLKLFDIYLKCQTGDIVGIVGRNGCGKSMLLKIIFGTEKAENKFVRIDGKVYANPHDVENQLVYLPQDQFLPNFMKIKKCIDLYINEDERVDFLEDEIISIILNQKVSEVSGGELRYFETKLLLYSKAKFILLDEPLSYVSPILKIKIMDLIRERSKVKGIIITDHDYKNLRTVINKLYLMTNGSLKIVNDENDLVRKGYLRSL